MKHITLVSHDDDPRYEEEAPHLHQRLPRMSTHNFPALSPRPQVNVIPLLQSGQSWKDAVMKNQDEDVFALENKEPYITQLMDLPLEIREMIYEKAMFAAGCFDDVLDVKFSVTDDGDTTWPSFLPAICKVSNKVLFECAPVFLRNSVLKIRSFEANQYREGFLDSIPGGKVSRGENNDLRLMARRPSLHSVSFTFHVAKFTKVSPNAYWDYWNPNDEYIVQGLEEVIAFYKLEAITKCEGLSIITFDGIKSWKVRQNTIGDPEKVLHDLAAWVEAEFLRVQGRKVTTNVTWRL